MANENGWSVDGFQFLSEKDMKLAQDELKKVEQLTEKLDYQNYNMLLLVYNKSIDKKLFKTPIGYVFLKKLQCALKEKQKHQEELPDIPVNQIFTVRDTAAPITQRVQASEKSRRKKQRKEWISSHTSILINIALMILIIIMFFISTTSSNPTIINYENVLQNKYAAWESELENREQLVREKEKKLMIENE